MECTISFKREAPQTAIYASPPGNIRYILPSDTYISNMRYDDMFLFASHALQIIHSIIMFALLKVLAPFATTVLYNKLPPIWLISKKYGMRKLQLSLRKCSTAVNGRNGPIYSLG